MPILDGIAATRRIVRDEAAPGARVLVLTTFDADENVVEALRAGASGFLLKDVTPADFVVAIKPIACSSSVRSNCASAWRSGNCRYANGTISAE